MEGVAVVGKCGLDICCVSLLPQVDLGCRLWCLWWCHFVLSFFPWGVLDEILNLIESVSDGFPSYSFTCLVWTVCRDVSQGTTPWSLHSPIGGRGLHLILREGWLVKISLEYYRPLLENSPSDKGPCPELWVLVWILYGEVEPINIWDIKVSSQYEGRIFVTFL